MRGRTVSSQPATYRIRVKGDLVRWSGSFDGAAIIPQPNGETLLTGAVVDRQALHRVLTRLRDLDLPLLHLQVAEIAGSASE